MGRIKSNLASRVKKGKMSQAAADAAMAKVKGTLDYADFGGCCGFCCWVWGVGVMCVRET
jgi:3-hydroxyacyl-CoA dehydrogenase